MNLAKIDLNLLIFLDVLLREKNVTRAAEQLNITQPAMSNALKRLRTLLNDPLLVRTTDGMEPTAKAQIIGPKITRLLVDLETALQDGDEFDSQQSERVFRVMASDYAASTLLPLLLAKIAPLAPQITIDVVTPSDVTFHDIETGKVDIAINRFDALPVSLHQRKLWQDGFACVVNKQWLAGQALTLDSYISAKHVWVSKTGFGIGVGMDPKEVQKLGWVDEALKKQGKQRNISVFTRNYHVALQLVENNLIATLPLNAANLASNNANVVIVEPPFAIPKIELSMIWSPLLQHDNSHNWFRQQLIEVAQQLSTV